VSVLNVGDHPWIKKPSFLDFADALAITPERAAMINALIGTKVTMQATASTATLSRIIQAAKASKAIPIAYKKYL
jgi:hypothetical protein